MSDPFESSKYSIERAKDHFTAFQRQVEQFFDDRPITSVIEPDVNGTDELHKIKLIKPMPRALRGLVTDTAVNLRSSLDQAVNSIAALVPINPTYFPFAGSAADFDNAMNGRFKNFPKEIADLMRTFKPYKGGNNLLWALNKLSNTNKHGIIRPVAVASGGIHGLSIHISEIKAGGSLGFNVPRWDRAKNEMIISHCTRGSKFEANFSVATHIAICDIEFIDGKPAIAVLNEFLGIVESIVMALEAEAKRIGLV